MHKTLKLIVATLLLTAFVGTGKAADGQMLRADKPAERLIVFIHGIVGTAESTWTNKEGQVDVFWPALARSDPAFASADIFVHEFESGVESDSPTVSDIVDALALKLNSDVVDIKHYSSVVFVAHSLGGIIVRKYLLQEAKLGDEGVLGNDRVQGMLLFGTPMDGSAVANVIGLIGNSPTLDKLEIKTDPEGFLQQLRREWINTDAVRNVPSDCAFETEGVVSFWFFDVKVVDRDSAEFLCNHRLTGLPKRNHNEIVKPEDAGADPHLLLRDWFTQIFPTIEFPPSDVVIAKCKHDTNGPEVLEKFETRLFDLSITSHESGTLPIEWNPGATPSLMFDKDHPPKVVVIHFSCFQNQEKQTAKVLEDRRRDFNEFLATIAETEIKVLAYSRAFASRDWDDNVMFTKANRKKMLDTGRFERVPLAFGRIVSDAEVNLFGQLVTSMLSENSE